MLPNFLIVGAAKSGTTSIYKYLNDHPKVFMSSVKEPYYFAFIDRVPNFQGPFDEKTNKREIITSRVKYEQLFKDVKDEIAIGECSNAYLYFTQTADNIKDAIPDCRIIIVLRNPIERAFSHYLQHKMLGTEMLSFENALEMEEERKKKSWRWHYQYVGQGMYYEQVKKYYDTFGKKNVRVYLFDDLILSSRELMKDLSSFLEIDSSFYENYDFKTYNKSGLPKSNMLHNFIRYPNQLKKISHLFVPHFVRNWLFEYLEKINYKFEDKPQMNSEIKDNLKKIFASDIIATGQLIGRNLNNWLQ